jgi:hypothetical protein
MTRVRVELSNKKSQKKKKRKKRKKKANLPERKARTALD